MIMARFSTLVIFLALTATVAAVGPPSAIAHEMKVIKFFLHDNLQAAQGPSSAFAIVPALNASDPTLFGALVVIDDSMTVDSDPNSLEIGRARGMYLSDSQTQFCLEFSFTAEFNGNGGYPNGSTITFKGLDRVTDPVREIAIVGGTREFRLARGWADITTFSLAPVEVANLQVTATVYYGL